MRCFGALALSVVFVFVSAAMASAQTVTATRGKFAGKVTVAGCTANRTGSIEISTVRGGTEYEATAFHITTDGAGNGIRQVPNQASGALLCKHNVRVVFPGGAICGPTVVKYVKSWFPDYEAGGVDQPVSVVLGQTVIDAAGGVLLETWENGANWILQLDPNQATWQTGSTPTVFDTEGDLSASVVSITSAEVTLQIVSDPTPETPNDIVIEGLRINVPDPAVLSIHPLMGLHGDMDLFYEGVLLDSFGTTEPTFSHHTEIFAAGAGLPALSAVGAIVIVLAVVLSYAYLALRRSREGARGA